MVTSKTFNTNMPTSEDVQQEEFLALLMNFKTAID